MPIAPPPTAIADATTVWFDGTLASDATLALHALTHALHYGSSIFEGIRLYPTANGPAIFRLRDHIERLFHGARTYGMVIPYSIDELCTIVVDVARASGREAAYIRPLVFFGGTTVKLAPASSCPTHTLVAVLPFDGLAANGSAPTMRATVSPIMKTPSAALPSWVKAGGHYTNSILALAEALERGFEEAILLNDRGECAEGSGENLFVVHGETLVTNDGGADILEGITRASVLALAQAAGIATKVRALTRDDLSSCDEAFFTGTAAEVVAISALDARQMPAARPVTTRLQQLYSETVRGVRAAPGTWLTQVS